MIAVNDPDFQLHIGDALETLQAMPAESVHCCVTSPPYWGLRDYGTGTWDGGDADCDHKPENARRGTERRASTLEGGVETITAQEAGSHARVDCPRCGARRVDQQLGLEPTPDQYVTNMVNVFREVRRVLRADGTLWLNIGDSYNNVGGTINGGKKHTEELRSALRLWASDLKPKDLVGIPWRLAFALQADGWYLRSDIIWSKPNPMPESVTDRPTKAHEYLFLLTKSPRYFYDADAIRETYAPATGGMIGGYQSVPGQPLQSTARGPDGRRKTGVLAGDGSLEHRDGERWPNPGGRNKRSVWEIATEAYPDAHFATFPQALVEPCVKAGTSEYGCCAECSAPWEREVESESLLPWAERKAAGATAGSKERGYNENHGHGMSHTLGKTSRTTGWRPTCDHADLTPVPAVCLDPFLGSGTTAQVARRLGRKSIGIELNPEYAELAARRLQQLSLFAAGPAKETVA